MSLKSKEGRGRVECSGSYMLRWTWEGSQHLGVSDYAGYLDYAMSLSDVTAISLDIFWGVLDSDV